MVVNSKDIKKILALFDPEDIPYIRSEKLYEGLIESDQQDNTMERLQSEGKVKIKKLGDRNDRFRK